MKDCVKLSNDIREVASRRPPNNCIAIIAKAERKKVTKTPRLNMARTEPITAYTTRGEDGALHYRIQKWHTFKSERSRFTLTINRTTRKTRNTLMFAPLLFSGTVTDEKRGTPPVPDATSIIKEMEVTKTMTESKQFSDEEK